MMLIVIGTNHKLLSFKRITFIFMKLKIQK